MRITPALAVVSLLAACSGERDPQVAKATPDEKRALDEAGAMIGAPTPNAPPSGTASASVP